MDIIKPIFNEEELNIIWFAINFAAENAPISDAETIQTMAVIVGKVVELLEATKIHPDIMAYLEKNGKPSYP